MNEAVYPKFRWYVLITILVATIAQGMILIAPSPLIGEVAQTLQLDLGAATAAAMLPFTLFVAIGGIIGGIVLDRFGVAKTFIVACLMVSICTFLVPVLGKGALGLTVLRAIQGLGCGPVIASGPRLAVEWFPARQRGMFQGLQGAALSLGITIGLMAGPIIAAGSAWQNALATFGGVMLMAFIMFIIYAKGPKSPEVLAELETGYTADDHFKNVVKLPVFWITLISVFALCWVQQGYNDLTPGHIAVPPPAGLGQGPQVAGQIMGLYTLAFMFGSMFSGFVSEKIFKGKYNRAITVTFFLTAIFCASVMFPAFNSSMGILTICLILAGFFMGMPMPTAMTFISNNYPHHLTGRIGGMTMGLGIFGGTAGVAAGSMALHATGLYTMSIIIIAVVAIIGGLAGFGINSPKIFEQKMPDAKNITM